MALNREESAIIFEYQNVGLEKRATEYARINEQGFKHNWTVEQHLESLNNKAVELLATAAPVQQQKSISNNPARTYNTGFGYYGTKKDAARGFDGIE